MNPQLWTLGQHLVDAYACKWLDSLVSYIPSASCNPFFLLLRRISWVLGAGSFLKTSLAWLSVSRSRTLNIFWLWPLRLFSSAAWGSFSDDDWARHWSVRMFSEVILFLFFLCQNNSIWCSPMVCIYLCVDFSCEVIGKWVTIHIIIEVGKWVGTMWEGWMSLGKGRGINSYGEVGLRWENQTRRKREEKVKGLHIKRDSYNQVLLTIHIFGIQWYRLYKHKHSVNRVK